MDPNSVKELEVVSWNIDGLEEETIPQRYEPGIVPILRGLNSKVIMLQEVVPSTLALLQEALGETYHVIAENSNFSYFTAVLINKNIVVESQSFRCFDNSKQGRGLQIVECSYNGIPLKIVNCHLESLGDNSAQRKAQFKELMETVKTLKDKNPESVVIGGGDLNIREKEVSRIPNGIKDAWIAAGSDAEKRWTWDTQKNDNKFPGMVRARFDRVYFAGPLDQVEFSLHGLERLSGGMFPSDHWALHCRFFRL